VTQVNDAGTFGGYNASGVEDNPVMGTLTFTDMADGASAPMFKVTTSAGHGTATIDSVTGAWTYLPGLNFHGKDTFIVTATDNDGNLETQVVCVSLSQVNDAGSFAGTSGTGAEDGIITGTLSFSDNSDGASNPNFTVVTSATSGTAAINSITGAWSYTPAANFHGSDSFTVSVMDNDGNSESQVVSVIVTQVNDAGAFLASAERAWKIRRSPAR